MKNLSVLLFALVMILATSLGNGSSLSAQGGDPYDADGDRCYRNWLGDKDDCGEGGGWLAQKKLIVPKYGYRLALNSRFSGKQFYRHRKFGNN
jgi:hypothetical protein